MIAGSLAAALAVLFGSRALRASRGPAGIGGAVARLSTMSSEERLAYAVQRRPSYQRWIQPVFHRWLHHLRVKPIRIDRTTLMQAGLDPDRIDGRDVLAWKLAGAAAGMIAGLIAATVLPGLIVAVPGLFWVGLMTPSAWLARRRHHRLDQLRRELPDLIGLLRALVSVGLPLEQALHVIAGQHWSLPLSSEEIARTMTAYGLGIPIDEALDEMSRRTGLEEMAGVTRAIATARRLGSGLDQVLRDQELVVRLDGRHRATADASRVGTRMLLVLAGVYLPEFAILIVIPLFWGIMRRAFG